MPSSYQTFVKKEMKARPKGSKVSSFMKVIAKKWNKLKGKK